MFHNPPVTNDQLSSVKGMFTDALHGTGQHPFVLLIDDDEDDSDLLSSSLKSLGIRVKVFISGHHALSYLDQHWGVANQPSLIILDYNMPGMNGQEVLGHLKSNENTRDIPVVLYSTSISAAFKITATESGAMACFTKPNTMLEFKEQVQVFKDWALSVDSREK